MTGLGTDLVAVACIMGAAVVSGGTTLAAVDAHRAHTDVTCVHAAMSPRLVVSLNGAKGTVVLPPRVVTAPRVWVHRSHGRDVVVVGARRDVRIDVDRLRAQLQAQMKQLDEKLAKPEAPSGQ